MKTLTDRQITILRHIHSCIQQNGCPPSIREIGDEFQITSLRGVTVHLDALQRKGCIERGMYKSRNTRLTEEGRHILGVLPVPASCPAAPLDAVLAALQERAREWERRANEQGRSPFICTQIAADLRQIALQLAEQFSANHETQSTDHGQEQPT